MIEPDTIISSQQFTPSSCERYFIPYLFEFAKSFVYRVFVGDLIYPDFSVIRITGKSDGFLHRPKLVTVSIEKENGFIRVNDNYFTATVLFHQLQYDISFYIQERNEHIYYALFVLGLGPQSQRSSDVALFIRQEGLQASPYRNAMHETTYGRMDLMQADGEVQIRTVDITDDRLSDVFLPVSIRFKVDMFVHGLLNYGTSRKALRYLFAGKPGTAKTKIIRGIANECRGKATFIFTSGNENRLESLFDFASLFSPVVVCIDDIDLLTGSRNEGTSSARLATFLQKLDGFVNRDFFLLATTNDKKLVDIAASRPGRFDMIIDVNLIQPQQYLELIHSKTQDNRIRDLFDDEVLSVLEARKSTGAFIANLVKHLELLLSYEPSKLTKEYLLSAIRESHQGFYQEPEPTNGRTGFHLA